MIAVVTIGVITASLVTKRAMMRQKQDEMAAVRAE
jgi:putrescine transport system permease protein